MSERSAVAQERRTLAGCWIWHPAHRRTSNCFVYFRRAFWLSRLDEVKRAELHASANAIYRLYVNGVEIGSGPSPSTPDVAYYDTYNVAKHLRRGKNVIAALVYAYGPEPRGVLHQRGGAGRFTFALEIARGGRDPLVIGSDSSVRCLLAPQYRRKTASISWHLGEYKEVVDLRKAPQGWEKPDFDDSRWRRASVLSSASSDRRVALTPREIPFMASRVVLPRNAYAIGYGHTYDCSRDPFWEIVGAESLASGFASSGLGGNLPIVGPFPKCIVRPIATGGDPTLVLDFGRLVNGRLLVDLIGPAGARVRVGYGESLNVTYVDSYVTRRGVNEIRPFGRRHARYLFLTFSDFKRPIEVSRVAFEFLAYPVRRVGSFRSSDPLLDRVYELCADTAELCMHDHFEDCPWREQSLYAGDVHVEGLASAALFGDTRLARKCLRNFAATQRRDGAIAPIGPRWDGRNVLLDYVAHYVLALRNYCLISGDLALGRKLFSSAVRAVEYYLAHRNKRGLIEFALTKSNVLFIDWFGGERPAENPVLHALVAGACDAVADLAGWLGRAADARAFRREAARVREAVNRWFLDRRRGLYRDSRKGAGPRSFSTRANAILALYSAPSASVARKIRAFIRSEGVQGLPKTPYFNFFVGAALGSLGAVDDMLWLVRSYWGEMVDRGAVACWEAFDPVSPPGRLPDKMWSLCHAWSAGPGYLLPTYVLGVTPVEPGWRTVSFRPHLGDLAFAEGAIPTPLGVARVTLRAGRRPRLSLPSGMKLASGSC
ncbi:MAG: alpha-L-rhamnosidase N-terminal domain-containing protein [Planctomycetota bacterium]